MRPWMVAVVLCGAGWADELPRIADPEHLLCVRTSCGGRVDETVIPLDELVRDERLGTWTLAPLPVASRWVDPLEVSALIGIREDLVVVRIQWECIADDPWADMSSGLFTAAAEPEVRIELQVSDILLDGDGWYLRRGIDSHSVHSRLDSDGGVFRSDAADMHEGIATWWSSADGRPMDRIIGGVWIGSCDVGGCVLSGTVTVTDWPMLDGADRFRQTCRGRYSDRGRHEGKVEYRLERTRSRETLVPRRMEE